MLHSSLSCSCLLLTLDTASLAFLPEKVDSDVSRPTDANTVAVFERHVFQSSFFVCRIE